MKYNTILFDLDGTLLDSLDDLANAVNNMLSKYNFETHPISSIRSFVGNGIPKLVDRSLPKTLPNDFDKSKFLDEFIAYYNDHNQIKTCPYPGVIETIEELYKRNISMAIVTNKIQSASESLLNDFFFPYIKLVVGDGDGRNKKPHPDGINEALKKLGVKDKETVLYVGDSEVDAATAENSNLDYILCTYGFREKAQLEEFTPIAFIDDIRELMKYV